MKQMTVSKRVLFLLAMLIVLWGMTLQANAATTVPNTFSAGTTISSSQMNSNFSALATAIDGKTSGVHFAESTAFYGITDNNVHNFSSVSITCPGAGYVLLIASGSAIFFGDNTVIDLSIGLSNTAMDTYFINLGRLDGNGTLRYAEPFNYTVVKSVPAAGTYTYYMNVQRESVFSANSVNVVPVTVAAIFIPNQY